MKTDPVFPTRLRPPPSNKGKSTRITGEERKRMVGGARRENEIQKWHFAVVRRASAKKRTRVQNTENPRKNHRRACETDEQIIAILISLITIFVLLIMHETGQSWAYSGEKGESSTNVLFNRDTRILAFVSISPHLFPFCMVRTHGVKSLAIHFGKISERVILYFETRPSRALRDANV